MSTRSKTMINPNPSRCIEYIFFLYFWYFHIFFYRNIFALTSESWIWISRIFFAYYELQSSNIAIRVNRAFTISQKITLLQNFFKMILEKKIITENIHAFARRNFPQKYFPRNFPRVFASCSHQYIKNYFHVNKESNRLLTMIDNVTRCTWAIPLKRKTQVTLNVAFKKLFSRIGILNNLILDEGNSCRIL